VLVDPNDDSTEPRVLFMVDHAIRETGGDAKVVSRRLQFVEIFESGEADNAGWAPHLDLQPIDEIDLKLVRDIIESQRSIHDLERLALAHATQRLVPAHYDEVRERRRRQVDKILDAVNERLVKEINHWSDRYIKLKDDVNAGRQPNVQPEMARRRVKELTARLEQRRSELRNMRNVVSGTPVVIGGALVVPRGLLAQRKGEKAFSVDVEARAHVEAVAMSAVMKLEESFGHEVKDVSAEKCGWDVTARPRPKTDGSLKPDRHIGVKGPAKGQTNITVSRNEIIYALNQEDKFLLAVVLVEGDNYEGPFYIRNPFKSEPDFGVASVNFRLDELLEKAEKPEATL